MGNGTAIPKNAMWYAKVREACLRQHPIMARLHTSGLTPLDFQFHEAEILKAAMSLLRKRGVPALPVHDSLVVPKSAREDARAVLSIAFSAYFRALMPDGPEIIPRVP